MVVPPDGSVRDLTPFSADDLALMRWTLTTVQAYATRRMHSRLYASPDLQQQVVKFEVALQRFDRRYLEDHDVVTLLAAFYALETYIPACNDLELARVRFRLKPD